MGLQRRVLAGVAAAGILTGAAACGSGSQGAGHAAPTVTVTQSAPATSEQKPAPTVTVTRPAPTRTPGSTTPAAAPAAPAAPVAPAPSARPPGLTNATAVVFQYYQDISNHDYAAAWALGGRNIAGLSYARYVAGFSTTASVTLGTVSEFGASQVEAVLYATQTDGTVKVFTGTYTVSGGVLTGASIRQIG